MERNYLRFFIIWFFNSLVVYLANQFAPDNFVLGSYLISPLGAVVVIGLVVALAGRFASVVLKKQIKQLKGRYSLFVFYWAVNAVVIWLIARVAPASGLGISSFVSAVTLGLALSLTQWLARQGFKYSKLI